MDRKLVISQPMFFPWLGLFEQIRLADHFIHYDDVQFTVGGFISRVQLKTASGNIWLTGPINRSKSGHAINETYLVSSGNTREGRWRDKHLASIKQALGKAPFGKTAIELAEELYGYQNDNLAEFNIHIIEKISRWLGLDTVFSRASSYGIEGSSSGRVLAFCIAQKANVYITGHGAYNYLDHEMFLREGIAVQYMQYSKVPYGQLHGPFTPYVTILDVIAHCGKRTIDLMTSKTISWRDYVPESH